MILLIDTSTPECRLCFRYDSGELHASTWDAGRTLAKGLLSFIHTELNRVNKDWDDIQGIGVFAGPGSFTGLRIGLTVMNTIARSEAIPIVGSTQEDWQQDTVARLLSGEDEKLVMPFYGSDARVTSPRK